MRIQHRFRSQALKKARAHSCDAAAKMMRHPAVCWVMRKWQAHMSYKPPAAHNVYSIAALPQATAVV